MARSFRRSCRCRIPRRSARWPPPAGAQPDTDGSRSVESRLAKSAVRAVADVQPDQLIAAPAGAQVLRRPAEGGFRRSERQDGRRDVHLLARLAVDVDAAGTDLRERLPPGCRGPEPIGLLAVLHGRHDTTTNPRNTVDRCAFSSSTGTCCAGPGPTGTTRASTRLWPGRVTRSICSTRTAAPPCSTAWTRWAAVPAAASRSSRAATPPTPAPFR